MTNNNINYFDEDIITISDSLRSIDTNQFKNLIDDSENALKHNHSIIASGLGKNVPICEKFEGTMLSLGLNARFLHTNSAVHGDLGMVKPGDVVIVLSKSGTTAETLYLIDLLKNKENVTIWLITCNRESTVTENSLVFDLEHEGDLWNIMPINSTTINLMILQKLGIELAKRFNLDLEKDFKPNHPGGAIGRRLSHEK